MRIECAYTFEDYREANLALARSKKRQWYGTLAFTAVVFVAALAMIGVSFVQLRTRSMSGPHWWRVSLNVAAIVAGVYLCARILTARSVNIRRAWNRQPELQLQRRFDVGDSSVVMDDSSSRMEFQWSTFRGFIETRHLLVLQPNDVSMLIIPKRAIPPAELEALRAVLHERVGRTGAFPVLPPKSAAV